MKVQNEISSMMGTMYSSLFYMIVAACLRHLPNKKHFPYFEGSEVVSATGEFYLFIFYRAMHFSLVRTGEFEEFTEDQFQRSIIFAALVFIFVALSLLLYRMYLFYNYPSMRPIFREFIWKAHLEPQKLGFQMMIVSVLGLGVVKLFMSYSRIWWVDSDLCRLDSLPPSPSPSPFVL
jgi:hypothetical protein